MPEPAAAYRPSPRPRPAGQPRPDQARLRAVPDPETEITETEIAGDAPSVEDPQVGDHARRATSGARFSFRVLFARSRAYWTPPSIFTDAPPTLADLAAYAKQAPWTNQSSGIFRTFGVGYYRCFGYPYTVVSRYREHVAQRPGRLLAHLALVKLASLTGPGMWAVDHLIYPAARLAGHLFL